ncbi:hypothetical protein M8C21_007050, partial [Ambrosia artemisiifolia]
MNFTAAAASLTPITNHASFSATNSTAEALLLLRLHDKPLHLSSPLVSKPKPFHGHKIKHPFRFTFIVSALRNGNGNDERETTLGAYSHHQPLTISNKSNDTPKETPLASSLYLSEDHSQHPQILANHGNLLDKLKAIHMHALAMEQWNASRLKQCHRRYAMSAANLIHYLALRSLDVDQIKDDLSSVGLLNLETISPYVIASLSAGIQMLENLNSTSLDGSDKAITSDKSEFTTSMMTNKANSNRDFLIGPLQDERTHIMVTVGREAISNESFIKDVLRKGATVIRINCAHGDPSVWSEIIRRVKMNSQMLEKPCRILMDLAGPKLRT